MKITRTGIEGVLILEPKVFRDDRGFFMESYNKKVFEQLGLSHDFVQDNHSRSAEAGTLRGLHYQMEPKAQTKVVRVLAGAILDVAVDIRRGSPTYGRWVSAILTSENFRSIVVPKGFAHGIVTLVPDTEILYKVDDFYSPEHDRGIRWNDPDLDIDWPFGDPILSKKDSTNPFFKEAEMNFEYT